MISKIIKLCHVLWSRDKSWVLALRHGVAASVEQSNFLRNIDCKTVVDIGANRGQYSLAVRHFMPDSKVIAFEPLIKPAEVFRQIFSEDSQVALRNIAIGPEEKNVSMHVSGKDDSSSLLPISDLQEEKYPGTGEVGTLEVKVAPLNSVLSEDDIIEPALLKLDVQGFEMDALRGCESLLQKFEMIYCECSFVELYTGQKLASDVIAWLAERGFPIKGIYNVSYDSDGVAIQADFLFKFKRS